MKSLHLSLFAAVAALATVGCNRPHNDEAARQAETFPNGAYESPGTSYSPTTGAPDRVGVDVDVDRTDDGVRVDADGYRIDDRGQRMGSVPNDVTGERYSRSGERDFGVKDSVDDVKKDVNDFGARVGSGLDALGDKIGDIGDDAKRVGRDTADLGHGLDDGVKPGKYVGDLDLGRTLNAKGDVADRTQQFAVGDHVVASVDADNLDVGITLNALLKDGAGKVIAKDSVVVKQGQENAGFELGSVKAAGDYVLTISGPQGEIESQSFSVHD
jgi:hypothetical protein